METPFLIPLYWLVNKHSPIGLLNIIFNILIYIILLYPPIIPYLFLSRYPRMSIIPHISGNPLLGNSGKSLFR